MSNISLKEEAYFQIEKFVRVYFSNCLQLLLSDPNIDKDASLQLASATVKYISKIHKIADAFANITMTVLVSI